MLTPTNLHWIEDAEDDPYDLCAHSPVEFRVGDAIFVRPEDGDWTVSAAALYLLRTLTRDHTPEQPVGDHLFPCCGFSMYDTGEEDVVICGCFSGRDCSVRHIGGDVQLQTDGGPYVTVPATEWRLAVQDFSDVVHSFYERCSSKQPNDTEDKKGFRAFRREWARRRFQQ